MRGFGSTKQLNFNTKDGQKSVSQTRSNAKPLFAQLANKFSLKYLDSADSNERTQQMEKIQEEEDFDDQVKQMKNDSSMASLSLDSSISEADLLKKLKQPQRLKKGISKKTTTPRKKSSMNNNSLASPPDTTKRKAE